jgi:CPA2 family monovalent cation:H+ antiporter-2
MGSYLLQEVIVIFGLSIGVLLACHRLGIPSIVGFLLTGVICGPFGLGLVSMTEDVQTLADLGVVLLLFSVGIEFSLRRVLKFTRLFFVGGGIQVLLTLFSGFVIAQILGRPTGESIFLGFLLSLSSTAIVLRVFDQRKEASTPSGKAALSMLIFQDIAAVPMMLMTPFLTDKGPFIEGSLFYTFGLGFVLVMGVFFASLKVVPHLMHLIASTRSRELFLLTTLCLCFSVAWITESVGLSLSLGAFLAGLIISETEYRNEAIEDILPFQDVFISFFFITIGMLLNIEFLLHNPALVIFAALGVLLLKMILAALAGIGVGLPLRAAVVVGFTIAQVGEFSFVLAQSGMHAGLASSFHYQLFLAVAVLTMAVTPSMMQVAPVVAGWLQKLPLPKKLVHGMHPVPKEKKATVTKHVVIIGFDIPGEMLAKSCKMAQIPYVIIEMDPAKVVEQKSKGTLIYYGDATHVSILKEANVENAYAIAVMMNEYDVNMRILDRIRDLNNNAFVIVRARMVDEMKGLFEHGADEVIPDEFGSSVEIFTRIMQKYAIDSAHIDEMVDIHRKEGYDLIRLLYKNR